jgi:hypothetical protein
MSGIPLSGWVPAQALIDAHLGLERAAKERDEAIQERDSARKELCKLLAGKEGKSSNITPNMIEIAQQRGWKLFDGETQ